MSELRYWLGMRKSFWREFFISGEWELREIHKYVRKSSIALDVGANSGLYAYHLSRMARQVHAFEPNPEYAARVEKLRLANVHVENVALSSRAGVATLRIPLLASGRENKGMASIEERVVGDEALSRAFEVPLRCLDGYGYEDVSFIKIDVEGHEESVLDGGCGTIERNRPTLLIEIEERHNPGALERVATKLSGFGYQGFYFDCGVRKPLREFNVDRDQITAAALDAAWQNRRSLRYINNFLFLQD